MKCFHCFTGFITPSNLLSPQVPHPLAGGFQSQLADSAGAQALWMMENKLNIISASGKSADFFIITLLVFRRVITETQYEIFLASLVERHPSLHNETGASVQ